MFLRELNRRQRSLFLDTSIHMANADGCFSDDEKVMVRQLCDEMDIAIRYEAEVNVNDALTELAQISTEREKRIILLELSGVVMADSVFAEEEKVLLEKISDFFGIDRARVNKLPEIMSELYKIYKKIHTFLAG